MPSKKKLILVSSVVRPRKYKLTEITVTFLEIIRKRKGLNSKDQGALIISCVKSLYDFYRENANVISGRDPSKGPNDPANLPDPFSSIGCINLVIRRNTSGTDVYVKMPEMVIEMIDEMVDFINDKYGFKSSSSVVNHAISFVFEDQDNALEEFVISSGLKAIM